MGKNIRHTLRSVVFKNFDEKTDKHALKRDLKDDCRIYSYSEKNNTLDVINNFSKYLKENCPEVKTLADLNENHARGFLSDKASKGCTQATISSYRSVLGKVGNLVNKSENTNINLRCDKVVANVSKVATRGSEAVISKDDYDKICKYSESNTSGSGMAILLERQIGVRVSDLAYGVTIKDDKLLIKSKGGKVCEREITDKIRDILNNEKFDKLVVRGDKLVFPKDDSINKYLQRVEDKLGIERHSVHDLRRFSAQEKYDEYRNAGSDRQQALGEVSRWLNHGDNREGMILKSYISNAW